MGIQIQSRDALADHLIEEIMTGRLQPGTKLPPERELAQQFGLSRPIVREILRGMHERGLIKIVPARGAFVEEPSASNGARSLESFYRRRNATAREVMEARLMLEAHAARLAAVSAKPADIQALETCLDDCERAEGVIDKARIDTTFHGLLARASHNTVIEIMFASITGLTFQLMLRSHADAGVAAQGMPFHRVILDAIRAGDPDAAEAATRAHLEIAGDTYGEDYDRSVEEVARRELQRFLGPHASLYGLLNEITRRVDEAADLLGTGVGPRLGTDCRLCLPLHSGDSSRVEASHFRYLPARSSPARRGPRQTRQPAFRRETHRSFPTRSSRPWLRFTSMARGPAAVLP